MPGSLRTPSVLQASDARTDARTGNWLDALSKEYRKRGRPAPYQDEAQGELGEDAEGLSPSGPQELNFDSFGLETRLEILSDLCNFHLENATYFMEHLMRGFDQGSDWVPFRGASFGKRHTWVSCVAPRVHREGRDQPGVLAL